MSVPSPLAYFWHHPRRTGFIIFNLAVLAAFIAWGVFTSNSRAVEMAGLPNLMIGYAGMVVLAVAWVGSWIAWGVMVFSRHRHDRKTG